jgi:diguanylate cyclase (GGDEF)-like protein
MNLRTQIIFSILGITFLAQAVFGFLAYRQITESRGDQLTIFLQYLNREIAKRLTMPGNIEISKIYLEELRHKFSTPKSTLIIQQNDRILYAAGNPGYDLTVIAKHLNDAYSDSDKHGLLDFDGTHYYWAVGPLPDNDYQLVMLEPADNEEIMIASTLRSRLITSGFIILWMAVWVSLLLSSKISKQLNEKNDQLKHLALHDKLTGLPNRTLLSDRLDQVLLQAERSKLTFSLFLMDLDRFKEVNDTLGHQFGDELLKMVSSRLLKSMRENDSIARLGGDEFAVLLPNTGIKGTIKCAERILQSMNSPFNINGISTESKVSIGIAIYPDHGNTVESLMQYADVAMYQAKTSQSGYSIYDPKQNIHTVRRLRLMNDLRDAVETNKIKIFYQPLIENISQKVVSVESLARWQHSELGNISPDEFIPMAEQMGLITLLTLQVLKQSLSDLSDWKENGYDLGININLSTYCLQDMSLPEKIHSILNSYDISSSQIEFEITESALMHDLSRARKIIDQLSAQGLKLAIDDFGTGFSSLSYLKNLPVDTLKIDKSFILDMCSNNSDEAIVKTIIELGHNLDCQVVAEGVESQMELDRLHLLKADILQGFFYSKPLPANDFFDWITNYNKKSIG